MSHSCEYIRRAAGKPTIQRFNLIPQSELHVCHPFFDVSLLTVVQAHAFPPSLFFAALSLFMVSMAGSPHFFIHGEDTRSEAVALSLGSQ